MYTLLDRYWMRKKRVMPPDAATNASMWWTQSKIAARVGSPGRIGTGWHNSVRQVLVKQRVQQSTSATNSARHGLFELMKDPITRDPRYMTSDVKELDDTAASVEQDLIERAENDTKAKDAENTIRLRVAMAVEKHSRDEDEYFADTFPVW
ncbi:hypothetical protein ARMGADRAFT_1040727 [Armillaria gallica]|uniref:Uncharacterized protein n=1 Tax=Armillaria gallica TaxID=47427 RepID=A0A2H3CW77_ARMGA|nr:hypothetical protein ARMGADRAFT_1040727 [Armillaria gallica]